MLVTDCLEPFNMTTAPQTPVVYLLGASGRLGGEIATQLAVEGLKCVPLSRVDIQSTEMLQQVVVHPGVVLDVSLPEGTAALCRALVNIPSACIRGVVIGATGHKPEHMAAIYEASKSHALVLVSNFSRGVFLLESMLSAQTKSGLTVAALARELGFDIGLFESHHSKKVDAPSGTAKTLANVANLPQEKIVSQRTGHVVGFHEFTFSGQSEELKLSHTAHSRSLFAMGAVNLAKQLSAKNPPSGLCSLADVLGR